MKTQRRHELHTNILSSWVDRQLAAIQPYTRSIAGVAVALVVILAAYAYLSHRSATSQAAAWEQTLYAMDTYDTNTLELTAKQQGTNSAGLWSRLMLAETQRIDGTEQLFSDQKKAKTQLDLALENFQTVEKHARDSVQQQQAMYGLARTYESLDKLADARTTYDKLVKEFPQGPFAETAAERSKDLDRDSTKSFYDWFAKQEPVNPGPNKVPSNINLPDTLNDLKPRSSSSDPLGSGLTLPGEGIGAPPPVEKPASDQTSTKTPETKQPGDLPPTVEAAKPSEKPQVDLLKPTQPGLEAKEPHGGEPVKSDDAAQKPSK